jgi:hypothetical protein
MDRRNMELAAQLLAKAQRTDFDAEAIALVEKSYALLAKVITAFDDEADPTHAGPRRRERRLLRDRRAARRLGLFGTSGRDVSTGGRRFSAAGRGPYRFRSLTLTGSS